MIRATHPSCSLRLPVRSSTVATRSPDALHLSWSRNHPDVWTIEGHRVAVGRELLVVGQSRPPRPAQWSRRGARRATEAAVDSHRPLSPTHPSVTSTVGGIGEQKAERLAIALGRLGGPARQRCAVRVSSSCSVWEPPTIRDVVGAWRHTSYRPPERRGRLRRLRERRSQSGFRRDGPHGMIAGTTGSGKSELLQTILTALALRPIRPTGWRCSSSTSRAVRPSPPSHRCRTSSASSPTSSTTRRWPRRAFTALDAEIDRRKRVLDAARVPDVIAYERCRRRTTSRCPTSSW